MASSIRRRCVALGFGALLSLAGSPSLAQSGARVPSSITGVVETPATTRQLPVAGVIVTVHRVAADSSGPVDSVRTDANGRYAIRFTRAQGDDGVYFAAAVYSGIAYFSAPIKSLHASGEETAITVFDTTSRAITFTVRGHHIVVSAPRPDGDRDLVEVWELSNDTSVTAVGRDSLSPVWSTPLPRGAIDVVGGQGDVPADALAARGDRLVMLGPFGPGLKQVSYSYRLPPSSFPLVVGMEKPASIVEVLVEEPAAVVAGSMLRPTDAAVTGGRTFKRFLGQDAAVGDQVTITVPRTPVSTRRNVLLAIAAVFVALMGAALFRALRRPVARAAPSVASPTAESLLSRMAQLDAQFERGTPSTDRAEYDAERAALKAQLAAVLARGDGPG